MPPDTAAPCPRWGDLGHNWIVIKGWLPWRRYRVCCACDHEEQVTAAARWWQLRRRWRESREAFDAEQDAGPRPRSAAAPLDRLQQQRTAMIRASGKSGKDGRERLLEHVEKALALHAELTRKRGLEGGPIPFDAAPTTTDLPPVDAVVEVAFRGRVAAYNDDYNGTVSVEVFADDGRSLGYYANVPREAVIGWVR